MVVIDFDARRALCANLVFLLYLMRFPRGVRLGGPEEIGDEVIFVVDTGVLCCCCCCCGCGTGKGEVIVGVLCELAMLLVLVAISFVPADSISLKISVSQTICRRGSTVVSSFIGCKGIVFVIGFAEEEG